MRALIDTNVILDVLFNREAFLPAAADVWLGNEQGLFEGFVSAITPVNVYYLARSNQRDKKSARQLAAIILDSFHVCPVGLPELREAISIPVDDYEDAVQIVGAIKAHVDVIVTRDEKDFLFGPIRAVSPAEFLQELV
jgi:predicted nucleic acid-binding protein